MKTLLIVDLQQDFMPTGQLPVPDAEVLVGVINRLQKNFDLIIASQDWHPPNHVSFASTHHKKPGELIERKGVLYQLWPEHCVQNTVAASFPKDLDTTRIEKIIYKGTAPEVESYSAFFDENKCSTGLVEYLHQRDVTDLSIVGVASDYCVKYTVLDACSLGLKPQVICHACRGLEDSQQAFEQMRAAGARLC